MNRNCERVLKYIVDAFNNQKPDTFMDISSALDIQVQDLKIIFDYLIENEYYIIFDKKNTNVDWNKYNGVPSIKGRAYFKNQKSDKLINFLKYSFFNVFMPILISLATTLITIMITQPKQ